MSQAAALAPSENIVAFAGLLRDHGLRVGVAEQQAMLQAAQCLGALDRLALGSAWRAVVCHSAREWRLWPDLFDRYWYPERLRGQVRVSGQTRPSRDLRQAMQQLHEQMATGQPLPHRAKSAFQTAADALPTGVGNEDSGTPRAQGGASRSEAQMEALQDRDGQMWLPQDLSALQRLARQITRKLRPLPTRRWRVVNAGQRLDLRKTLRHSVSFGGEHLAPAWQTPREEPPRLFILVDVSRSMESHAAFFLRVARAFSLEAQARVFVFHTRLSEVTSLMQRDSRAVQEKVNAVTAGFGAGTRIAWSLQDFARTHARAQLRRGARVWVMSDGFDTDEPHELASALATLRARGSRITWFHPTRKLPAATAIKNAREHIQQFVPLANLVDLANARPLLH